MKWDLKPLPNKITLIRFIAVFVLWILAYIGNGFWFGIVFLIAGITDFLDGFVARTFKMGSEFGVYFDSLSDDMVNFSIIFWVYLLIPEFFLEHIVILLILFSLFIISIGSGYIKFKKLPSWHIYSFKLTNWFLYCFILIAVFFEPHLGLFYALSVLAALALTESIILNFISDELESNRKSIFFE
tara:strand:+ start:3324 stop:3878 length:555 start_codon:yes stop_codon:yes gene_type:complete